MAMRWVKEIHIGVLGKSGAYYMTRRIEISTVCGKLNIMCITGVFVLLAFSFCSFCSSALG